MATNKDISSQDPQESINLQDLLSLCVSKWHWFVISLAVCLGAAEWYMLVTPPVYTRSASILIKEDSKGKSVSGEMEAFSDLGLFTSRSNVNNEMGTLRSPDLMREVVSRLGLNVDYLVPGRYHLETAYRDSLPVSVAFVDLPEVESAAFTLHVSVDGAITLSGIKRNGEEIGETELHGALNDTIACAAGRVVVFPTEYYRSDAESLIHVRRLSSVTSLSYYVSGLKVSQEDEKSNIIKLSFRDLSIQRADDVLSTLIAVYNENWVMDRNRMAVSTSGFIDERLGVIEGELGNVDDDISSYKSEHLLPDVQAAASMYMTQAREADAGVNELSNQVYMARHIRNYLTDSGVSPRLLPTNSGIDDASLTAQISEYNRKVLDRNSLVAHSSERNPLVVEIDASLSSMRGALLTSIDNQIMSLNARIKSLQGVGGLATSRIASNPQQAKYLLSVERQQKVKESLYLFLLQKREENELSQAFTSYNTRVISMPGGGTVPTAPVGRNILLIAFLLGLAIPVGVVFLRESMNTRVRGRKDLESLTVPFVGEIPLFVSRKNLFGGRKVGDVKTVVVKEGSRNLMNEAFRVLRTNLEFMAGRNGSSEVIVVTSFNPGSGKSFLSLNIAVSLAIKGKRVLVIDGDLRHGSASSYVGSPHIGLSDYLGGREGSLNSLIVSDPSHAGLDLLPVGTNPPNPTELLFSDRFARVIDTARGRYDYVLIDCPPVELVADTRIIGKFADRTMFVVRAGLLERGMLPELERLYKDGTYRNMCVVLNGTEGGHYGYRYSYRYGYHYGYGYGYHYGSDRKRGGGN